VDELHAGEYENAAHEKRAENAPEEHPVRAGTEKYVKSSTMTKMLSMLRDFSMK
jgi:hypothetical protein